MKTDYTKENLESIVKESYSFSEVIKKLGLQPVGSTFKTVKKYISLFGINTDHFSNGNWRKGKKQTYVNKLEDILKPNVNYSSSRLLKRLIDEGIKIYECERCHSSEWLGQKLILELHHIDGDHYNNSLDNLQILCPNCHSQTPYFRSRTKYKDIPKRITTTINEEKECPICHKMFKGHRKTTKYCSVECYREFLKQNKQK